MQGTCPEPTEINDEVEQTEKSRDTNPTAVVDGPAGTEIIVEEFCNKGLNTLTLLQSRTTTLTGGNVLLNRDTGTPKDVGSVVTFPSIEGFEDRILEPNECVTVTYKIGLQTTDTFDFFVDVVGGIVEPTGTANTTARTTKAPPIPLSRERS
jgi:hypothetical protein